MDLKEALQRFKDLNLEQAVLTFDCGGDSMGNTEWELQKEDGEVVEDDDLTDFFDNEVYNKVDFYVNSDGYYNGEAGTVTVTIETDGDDDDEESDDEEFFSYSKRSMSEYTEQCVNTIEVKLTPAMAAFISEYVSNINGGDSGFTINYKKDFLLTDEQETLVDEIEALLQEDCEQYEPEMDDEDGSLEDWFNYTTNTEDDDELTELTIKDENILLVRINNTYTISKED
jgi:hypothetical protein